MTHYWNAMYRQTGSQTQTGEWRAMIQEEVWYLEKKRKRLRTVELAFQGACKHVGERDTMAPSGKGKAVVPPGCSDNPKAICGSVVWEGEEYHPDQTYSLRRMGPCLWKKSPNTPDFCNNVGRKDGCSQLRLVVEDSLPSQCGECLQLFEW